MKERLKKFLDKLCPLQAGDKVVLKRSIYFFHNGREYTISKGEKGMLLMIHHNFYRVKFGEFLLDFNGDYLKKFLERDYED